jgi:hypothetical protein
MNVDRDSPGPKTKPLISERITNGTRYHRRDGHRQAVEAIS